MRDPLIIRRLLASCLGATVVLGVLPGVASGTGADHSGPSRIGALSYDRASGSLLIPVQGLSPDVHLTRLSPRQYVADLAGSVLVQPGAQGQRLRGSLLAGWSLAEAPRGQSVRLRLTLTDDAGPIVRVAPRTGGLAVTFRPAAQTAANAALTRIPRTTRSEFPVRPSHHARIAAPHSTTRVASVKVHGTPHRAAGIAPLFGRKLPQQLREAATAHYPLQLADRPLPLHAAPAAVAGVSRVATLGVPRFDAHRDMLVVPVTGRLDPARLATIQLNQRWSYLDLPNAKPSFDGVRYEIRANRLMQRWVMAKRPGRDTTRLSFASGAPARLDVALKGQELLIAVRPNPVMLGSRPSQPAPVAVATRTAPVASAPHVTRVAAQRPALRTAARPEPTRAEATMVAGTRLSRPFFDSDRYGLVLPYQGELPLYRVKSRASQAMTLEVKGDLKSAGLLMQRFKHHAMMASWEVRPLRASGSVLVDLRFKRPAELVVAADAVRHQLLMIAQPTGNDTVAAAGASKLSGLQLERDSQHLYIPFSGKVPRYTVEQLGPSLTYINFEAADLTTPGVQFFSPDYHPLLNYSLLTERASGHGVRLALALSQRGGAQVYEDRAFQRLVIDLTGSSEMVGSGRPTPRTPALWPAGQRTTGFAPGRETRRAG